jgi:KaiC/GvpD/RAD55 family RecA-like ATPase
MGWDLAGGLTPTGVEGLDAVLAGGFPRGSLIVLAGCPGTGKTSFSAQFLYRGCVDYGESGVYVSFAESKETFYMNMRSMGCDFERLEKDGRFRFLELLTVKEEGIPYAAEMILKAVEEAGAKRLVIDSLSAMAQAFREPHEVRVLLHSILGKICRSLGCTALIITEISYENTVAYGAEGFVADGILLLKKNHLEGGRHLRLLEIVKMRGTPTPETQIVFTLKDGFKAFPAFKAKPIDKPQRFKPQPDTEQFFSSGSPDLDVMLGGGYPKGSAVLLEVDEHISTLQYHLLAVPICWNFVTHGRGVIIIPSAGVDVNIILKRCEEGGLTREEITNLLRVCVKGIDGIKLEPYLVPFKGEDISEDYKRYLEVEKELMERTGQPILRVTGADMLISAYGLKDAVSVWRFDASRISETGGLGILILKPGYQKMAKILASIADIHLKLTRECGVPIVYGIKPRTGFYAIEMDTSQGYAMPKLTQII